MTDTAQDIRPFNETAVLQAMPQFRRIADENKLVKWDEESQFAIQALTANRVLRECNQATIQNAIINVAAVGLTLNPADGYAYLVPQYNKQSRQNECVLRISFKGLIKAATDSGVIEWVRAEVVKQNDTFRFRGVDEKPDHEMEPFGDRGEPVGVYCVAKLKTGEYLTDVMDWAEVEKIRQCAQTDAVWKQWPIEMAKKAIIKRAAKQWPKSAGSSVLHKAIEVINSSEGSADPMLQLEATADLMLEYIQADDGDALAQIWDELDEKERSILWTAKTKGGWFTYDEKDYMRKAYSSYKKRCAGVTDE